MINERNKLIIIKIKIKSNYKYKFPYEGNYIHCILSSKYNIPIVYKIYLSCNIKNKYNTITWTNLPFNENLDFFISYKISDISDILNNLNMSFLFP
jgi:hypothetical protein